MFHRGRAWEHRSPIRLVSRNCFCSVLSLRDLSSAEFRSSAAVHLKGDCEAGSRAGRYPISRIHTRSPHTRNSAVQGPAGKYYRRDNKSNAAASTKCDFIAARVEISSFRVERCKSWQIIAALNLFKFFVCQHCSRESAFV